MITEFKIYERFNEGKPEVGDYVICGGGYIGDNDGPILKDFVLNDIGKVENDSMYLYKIIYSNSEITKTYYTKLHDIIYWSKNKEELYSALNTNKFNI